MSNLSDKIAITPRWYGDIPTCNGQPRPMNQWARYGRKRRWCVRWYSPDGKRPRKTFGTKEEAETFVAKLTTKIDQHGPQARLTLERVTIGTFADEVIKLRIGPGGVRLSVGTICEYKTILNRFADYIGRDTHLDRITMAHATRYISSLKSPDQENGKSLSICSVNKHKRVLKSGLNIAVQQLGYLQHNPLNNLKQDRVPQHDIRYITPEEFQSIIVECRLMNDPLWWKCFLVVCYTSGTRLNEATHLTWADIDFEKGTILISAKPELDGVPAWHPKDHDLRRIPVPEQAMVLLSRLHSEAEEGSRFVFLSPERVAWIKRKREIGKWREGQDVLNNVNNNFKKRATKAKVEGVSLHDLRRSAISHWARRLPAPVTKELAGHGDINTTLRYYVSIRDVDMAEARDITAKTLQPDPIQTQNGA